MSKEIHRQMDLTRDQLESMSRDLFPNNSQGITSNPRHLAMLYGQGKEGGEVHLAETDLQTQTTDFELPEATFYDSAMVSLENVFHEKSVGNEDSIADDLTAEETVLPENEGLAQKGALQVEVPIDLTAEEYVLPENEGVAAEELNVETIDFEIVPLAEDSPTVESSENDQTENLPDFVNWLTALGRSPANEKLKEGTPKLELTTIAEDEDVVEFSTLEEVADSSQQSAPHEEKKPIEEDLEGSEAEGRGEAEEGSQEVEPISESLADLYVLQGYTKSAKDMYEKLAQRYPEKRRYFAAKIDQIEST